MLNRTFSKKLQMLRKEKKVTQEQLASCLGVSAQAVSKWENGSYPEGDLLPALSDYFGVSIDYLYGRCEMEKSFEQTVFEKVYNCCVEEFEKTGNATDHHDVPKLIRNILWAVQTGLWVSNQMYSDPPLDKKEHPKTASVAFDNRFFSYMGLREDNDFYILFNTPEKKHICENLLRNAERFTGLFAILSEKENIDIIAYLYSLKYGEFAAPDMIARELGRDVKAVEDCLERIKKAFDGAEPGAWTPLLYVKVVGAKENKKVYGVDPVLGGLFMGLILLAQEYSMPPVVYNQKINCRSESWIDRKKMGELKHEKRQ